MSWALALIAVFLLLRFTRSGGMMSGGCGHGMMGHGNRQDGSDYDLETAHDGHDLNRTDNRLSAARGGSKVAEFNVLGMATPHCAETVSAALRKVPGVDDVVVNLRSGMAIVIYDAAQTDQVALKAAVSGAGYEPVDPLPEPVSDYGYDRRGGHGGHRGHCC